MSRGSTNQEPEAPCGEGEPPRFERSMAGLEKAVQRLESGELSLDEALACYQEGLELLIHCRKLLDEAERRVSVLTSVEDSGAVQTEPFDTTASYQPEAAAPPSARKGRGSRSKPAPEPVDEDDAPF